MNFGLIVAFYKL